MQTFQAYLIEGSPASTTARFAELTDRDFDAGDVTMRVAYASINFKDALAATGKGRIIRRFPCVGGSTRWAPSSRRPTRASPPTTW
jgi:NADPH:quinone reductase-like Zn-dependent oxidoreductase